MLREKKRLFSQQTAEKLGGSINNSTVFWNSLRKLGLKSRSVVSENINTQKWFEHFQKVFSFNENYNDDQPNTENDRNEEEQHVLDQVITFEEVENAVKRIQCGKACGIDGIVGEMLKSGGELTIHFLRELFNKIFDSGVYPKEWSKAIVVPIFKKGDRDNPDNHRGVSLINITCKCFTSILNQRLYA